MKKRLSGIGLACGLALLTSCDAALNLPIRKDSSTVINMGDSSSDDKDNNSKGSGNSGNNGNGNNSGNNSQTPSSPPPARQGSSTPVASDITVTPAQIVLEVGSQQDLLAEVTYADGQVDGNVRWTSSDSRIAQINATTGRVNALREGRVTIVAASTINPRLTFNVQVSVQPQATTDVKVTIKPSENLKLVVDETVQLTAEVKRSNGDITTNFNWKSNNPRVATVTGGLVTANNPGKTQIVATSQLDSSITKTITVTVSEESGSDSDSEESAE